MCRPGAERQPCSPTQTCTQIVQTSERTKEASWGSNLSPTLSRQAPKPLHLPALSDANLMLQVLIKLLQCVIQPPFEDLREPATAITLSAELSAKGSLHPLALLEVGLELRLSPGQKGEIDIKAPPLPKKLTQFTKQGTPWGGHLYSILNFQSKAGWAKYYE